MTYIILSCSLSQNSFGDKIGRYIEEKYEQFELINVSECEFGLCDGFDGKAFENPKLLTLQKKLEKALGVIIISPIYNFDVSATCKNLMDLLSKPYKDILSGKSLYHKVISFIGTCCFGHSYMAPLNFLANTMLAHEAFIFPKYTLVTKDMPEARYQNCVDKMLGSFIRMSESLRGYISEDLCEEN
ncbi:MAG: NAD(P)H-dependent oxidoreductase [Alphaproteobacteria bacterium]|nr:MAG: NAD(P)H-dependent oxidoreductase [Alphaproteobacteria bacterium]